MEKQCDLYSSSDRVQPRGHENTVRKLPVPQETGDFFTNVATVSFSRRIMLHGTNYGKEIGYTNVLPSSVRQLR
jgi:hypothetical protein